MVGKFIQKKGKTFEGLAKLLLLGFAFIVIGYFWDLGFPINKKLWTSSFVVYTVGLDCVIISAIIYVVDFLGRTKWTKFFTVFGKNPLVYISRIGSRCNSYEYDSRRTGVKSVYLAVSAIFTTCRSVPRISPVCDFLDVILLVSWLLSGQKENIR